MSPGKDKPPLRSGIRRKTRRLRPTNSALYRDKRLLSSSKILDTTIRKLVRCYAEQKTAKQAMAETGLSHVTVYRLFGLIRKRLVDADMYRSFSEFHEQRFGEFPTKQPTQEDERIANAVLKMDKRSSRAVSPETLNLIRSENMFRLTSIFSAPETYKLILLVIRGTGPLNEPPRPFKEGPYMAERLRIMFRKQFIMARRYAAEGAIDGRQLLNALEYGLTATIRTAMKRSRSMPDDPE
ncbi:MAG: hypothetical protein U1E62_18470 [Alsobacter sp.]